ncbi:MAG: hypothetical protein ACI9XO_003337 [Paraglaciecola sp.]|jgi:hypothetical protein
MTTQHTIDPSLFLHSYLFDSVELGKNEDYLAQDAYAQYRKSLIAAALSSVIWRGQEVLQVGVQHADFLKLIANQQPAELYGVGLFPPLIDQAEETLAEESVNLSVFQGKNITFPKDAFDNVFTADFLQQYADSKTLNKILYGLSSVVRDYLILVEDTRSEYLKTPFYRGREVGFYQDYFEKKGLELIQVSHYSTKMTDKFRQKLRDKYNPPQGRIFGAPLTAEAKKVEKKWLPYVQKLDGIFREDNGLTKMVFKKTREEIQYY